jgi:hypothetical protein
MTSDSADGGNPPYCIVLIDGHDNYKECMRYLRNLLLRRDLHDVADGSEICPTVAIFPHNLPLADTQLKTPISAATYRPNLQLDNTSTTPAILPSPKTIYRLYHVSLASYSPSPSSRKL